MDKETKRYRWSELDQVQENQDGYKTQIQIVGVGGRTKWLSITNEELKKIKKLLTEETNMTTKYTPKYGIDEIKWENAINLGFRYVIRTLDSLTNEVNQGSSTLTYCCTRQQAEFIVRAVNSDEELLNIAKKLLSLLPSTEGFGGHAPIGAFVLLGNEAREAIAKAEGK